MRKGFLAAAILVLLLVALGAGAAGADNNGAGGQMTITPGAGDSALIRSTRFR